MHWTPSSKTDTDIRPNPSDSIASSFRPSDDATTPSVSDSVQLLRRLVAAQGCGDPAHGKPRRNPGIRLRNARRRGRTGPERACRLRPSAVREDLRFRNRRFRQPPADGRCQRPQPARHDLSGRHRARRSRLPEHPAFRMERDRTPISSGARRPKGIGGPHIGADMIWPDEPDHAGS